jgi:dihydrofolate synthase/folylpolyglutamate synthase
MLAEMGNPESSYPALLIAGTNGKGSTGAFLAHALKTAGKKVGWTTSPHLVSPSERIWIDGQCISEKYLGELLARALGAECACGAKATYFELMIASALQAFKESSVDVAVVEVGLGGRWDSTNALDPILTVLTNVAFDHTAHLGNTLEAIAREKLCTARDGRTLVIGPGLDPSWLEPLCECRPIIVPSKIPDAEIFWDYSLVCGHLINLAGEHQVRNLATAMTAIDALQGLGWGLNSDAIFSGFSNATWPGRLWPVPGLKGVIFDGAHNAQGAKALASHMLKFGVSAHIIFCAMSDKDIVSMARELAATGPLSVTVAQVDGTEDAKFSRCSSVEAMQRVWQNVGYGEPQALTLEAIAAKLRQNNADTILVTGSLYFLGHLMKELNIAI